MKNILAIALALAPLAASASNSDSKECTAFGGHLAVTVDDIHVTAGQDPHPYYSISADAYFPPPPYPGSPLSKSTYYIDLTLDLCIAGQCQSMPWNESLYLIHDIHSHSGGPMGIPHMSPIPKGTYNSTVRLHSRMLQCDVTAVGTVFVE